MYTESAGEGMLKDNTYVYYNDYRGIDWIKSVYDADKKVLNVYDNLHPEWACDGSCKGYNWPYLTPPWENQLYQIAANKSNINNYDDWQFKTVLFVPNEKYLDNLNNIIKSNTSELDERNAIWNDTSMRSNVFELHREVEKNIRFNKPLANYFLSECGVNSGVNGIKVVNSIRSGYDLPFFLPSNITYSNASVCKTLPLTDKYDDVYYSNSFNVPIGKSFNVNTDGIITKVERDGSTIKLTYATPESDEVEDRDNNIIYAIDHTVREGTPITISTASNVKGTITDDLNPPTSTTETIEWIQTFLPQWSNDDFAFYNKAYNECADFGACDNYPLELACNDDEFLSGWRINDNNSITPYCIKYTVTSSARNMTCPEDGVWPLTDAGKTVVDDCPSGYKGTITRVCNDNAEWEDIESNCTIIKCPADGSWESKVPGNYSLPCTSGTGNRSRTCSDDGEWSEEISTCKTDDGLICSADGDWPVTNVGSMATITCDDGTKITRRCIEEDNKAKWKSPSGSCSSSSSQFCPADGDWPETKLGSVATIKCDLGYNVTRQCKQVNGKPEWGKASFICIKWQWILIGLGVLILFIGIGALIAAFSGKSNNHRRPPPPPRRRRYDDY